MNTATKIILILLASSLTLCAAEVEVNKKPEIKQQTESITHTETDIREIKTDIASMKTSIARIEEQNVIILKGLARMQNVFRDLDKLKQQNKIGFWSRVKKTLTI